MIRIHCPYCGVLRSEQEFSYAGQAHIVRPPDPSAESDEDWRDYLYLRENTRGPHAERWRHSHGCGRYFNVIRDTVTDRVLATYRMGETAPELTSTGEGDD